MIADNGAHRRIGPEQNLELIELGTRDSPEMIELTSLTKPGPFGTRTHELGTYLGIRIEGKLVAMAGERLKVPGSHGGQRRLHAPGPHRQGLCASVDDGDHAAHPGARRDTVPAFARATIRARLRFTRCWDFARGSWALRGAAEGVGEAGRRLRPPEQVRSRLRCRISQYRWKSTSTAISTRTG